MALIVKADTMKDFSDVCVTTYGAEKIMSYAVFLATRRWVSNIFRKNSSVYLMKVLNKPRNDCE